MNGHFETQTWKIANIAQKKKSHFLSTIIVCYHILSSKE